MSERLVIVARREGRDWRVNAAIGEPGREHAREVAERSFIVSHENLSIVAGLIAGSAADEDFERQVREFVGPYPP